MALGVLASTADTYFQILTLQARLEIARENLDIAVRVLKAIQARISVGTATALDLAQQESVVATERVAIPPLQEQLEQTRNALAILLGRLPEKPEGRGRQSLRHPYPRRGAGPAVGAPDPPS